MSAGDGRGWNARAREKAAAARRERRLAVELPVLDTLRALRAEGRSWRAIAACLKGRFDPPGRRGKWPAGRWSHKSVQRIARRHGIADEPAAAPRPERREASPAPPTPRAPAPGATLADLDSGETLAARCRSCRHMCVLDAAALGRGLGPTAALHALRARLRCTVCGVQDAALYRAVRVEGQSSAGLRGAPGTPATNDGGHAPPGAGP